MARSKTAVASFKPQMALFFLLAAAALILFTGLAQAQSLDKAQKSEIEALVRDYILEHPEVVIEAIQKYQEKEQLAQQANAAKALASAADIFKEDGAFPRAGNKDGDVLFVEFFDYQCGYCKKVFPDVMAIADKDKNLNMVFVEFPILSKESEIAARTALAAEKQGKYMETHVALMGYRGRLSEEIIQKVAASVGLDMEQLAKDMESEEIADQIKRNRQLAQALGLRGTPAFIIGDNLAPGAISKDSMLEMIRKARLNG